MIAGLTIKETLEYLEEAHKEYLVEALGKMPHHRTVQTWFEKHRPNEYGIRATLIKDGPTWLTTKEDIDYAVREGHIPGKPGYPKGRPRNSK